MKIKQDGKNNKLKKDFTYARKKLRIFSSLCCLHKLHILKNFNYLIYIPTRTYF